MKSFSPAVFLCLMLIGVIGAYWLWLGTAGGGATFSEVVERAGQKVDSLWPKAPEGPPPAPITEETLHPKKTVVPVHRAQKKVEPETPEPSETGAVAAANTPPAPLEPPPAPKVERPPSRFPEASEIPVGTERFRLLADFGRPAMITTSMSDNRFVETFVYFRGDTATYVQVQDGRVIAARTGSY
ncbi:MAG TPA: hypothetical protein VFA54_15665 [Bryobacterales bacterium]|jgi:hypothetical protein|nr:hypothetical protein [Bryobacterales bacterium]